MSGPVRIDTEGVPIQAWIQGVELEESARRQLENVARLPIVHRWVAVMPDVHWGIGATVGSVIPTRAAIVPAAVGVDLGCGMCAVRTSLGADRLPDSLRRLRTGIEKAVPHGYADRGGKRDRGSWSSLPESVLAAWKGLEEGWRRIAERRPELERGRTAEQLGTLGSGNHFVELCLDEEERLWVLLHSGSRGVGNRIGTRFIELARERMGARLGELPDRDLAWLEEGARDFDDYVHAVGWAQRFARENRRLMLAAVLGVLRAELPAFELEEQAIDCHHNYVEREHHYGADVWVTRKGAVSARRGQLGLIPGSMGAASFVVRGKGEPRSFESCSHGAGRRMSRGEARRRFTLADHERDTQGIECRKDERVLDETPRAYKSIEAVMAAQSDLVEVVHTLRQVVCVKG